MRAVGYARVSTDDQGDSGLGLAAQETSIRLEVERRGWDLVEPLYVDVASGKSMKKRPELAKVLTALDAGDVDVLVVAKLDRLARSVPDFSSIIERSRSKGWALDVVDPGVDTSTPNGKMVAQILMVLAEWEREIIAQRTKAGLAETRRNGTTLGRRPNVSHETLVLIRTLRTGGQSYHSIARILNEGGVPTAQGGKQWYPATVKNVHERDVDRAEVDVDQLAIG
jgi:DNA invertase Pin-like site-specific DNA recombinase